MNGHAGNPRAFAEAMLRLSHQHDRELLDGSVERLEAVLGRRDGFEVASFG